MKLILKAIIAVAMLFSVAMGENMVARGTPATLTGLVWYDEDANGIQNEPHHGIGKIKVHLLKDGTDIGSTETNMQGIYKFENLEPNHKYSIKVLKPKNYPYFTIQNQGDDDTKDSDIDIKTGISDQVTLKAGETYDKLDAGLLCRCKGALRIEKSTNDKDADTAADAPIIKIGAHITWKYVVTNPSNIKICNIKVVDNREGAVSCPSSCLEPQTSMTCVKEGTAKPGSYKNIGTVTGTPEGSNRELKDSDPSNYIGSKASISIQKLTNGKDSDNAPGEELNIGDKVTWKYIVTNTGNLKLTHIVVKDNKEGIISCPKSSLNPGEKMTCTKDGIVKEGKYENEATVTADSEIGKVHDSDTSHYVGGGTACIGNYLWLDSNLNGIQESGELGVVDIGVELYDAAGNHIASTKTDNNGEYMFCGLKPGKYKIKFDQPNTYLFTLRDRGDDAKDSDVDSNGWSHVIDLKAGQNNLTIDAGIYCECDDYLVHPDGYKKVSAEFSMQGALLMLLFTVFATLSLRRFKKKDI